MAVQQGLRDCEFTDYPQPWGGGYPSTGTAAESVHPPPCKLRVHEIHPGDTVKSLMA